MIEEQLNSLEELLNKAYTLAVKRDEEMGNGDNLQFANDNPDYRYYRGILAACDTLRLPVYKRFDKLTDKVIHIIPR